MATVYLAHDERHNRNVALKVLKAELAAVVGAERFLAEIETTAKLTHCRLTMSATTLTSCPCTIPARLTASCSSSRPTSRATRFGTRSKGRSS